jgi:hypothetical protein
MPDDSDATLDEDEPTSKKAPAARTRAKKGPEAAASAPADDEEGLPELPQKRGGGSGAVWAAVILIIVVALVAGVWLKVKQDRKQAAEARANRLSVVRSQLGVVQTRVDKALREFEQPQPNVDQAIDALNTAAEGITALTQQTMGVEQDVAAKLTELQGELRQAAQGLEQDRAQYEKAVKQARDDLKLAATRRVNPALQKLRLLTPSIGGGLEQPVPARRPAGGAGGEAAPAAGEATEAAAPAAGGAAPTVGSAAPVTGASAPPAGTAAPATGATATGSTTSSPAPAEAAPAQPSPTPATPAGG